MILSGHELAVRSLRGYQRSWLRGDLNAGLTVWAVLVAGALRLGFLASFISSTVLSAR